MVDQFIQIGTGGSLTALESAALALSSGASATYDNGFVDVNLTGGSISMSFAHWSMLGHYDHQRKEIQLLGKNANTGSGDGEIGHVMFDLNTDGPWRVIRRWGVGTTGHIYSSHTIDPATGDHYYIQWSDEFAQRYNRASDSWISNTSSAGVDWGASPPHACLAWHPDLFGVDDGGLVVLIRQLPARIFFWRKQTGAWTNSPATGQTVGATQDGGAIYSPAMGAVVLGAGQDTNKMWKVTTGPVVTPIADVPINMGAHFTQSPMTLHPSGYPMIVEQTQDNSSSDVYVFNGSTWVLQSYSHPFNAVPSTSGDDEVFITVPMPELGIILGIKVTSDADFCSMTMWRPPANE